MSALRPIELLSAFADLKERLNEPRFVDMTDAFGMMEFGRSGGYRRQASSPGLSASIRSICSVAEIYRVTEDMSMLVRHAADELDELDRVDISLAPTQAGFVHFDKPLTLRDVRGRTMLISFLLWGPVGYQTQDGKVTSATLVHAYNDTYREPDDVQQAFHADLMVGTPAPVGVDESAGVPPLTKKQADDFLVDYGKVVGRWSSVGSQPMFNQMRLGPPKISIPDEQKAQLLAQGVTPSDGDNIARYIHALWLLMGQSVVVQHPEQLDRTARRQAERRKIPGKITVIKLRREVDQGGRERGESQVEWAHRWVVKGHWRWQAVGEHHPLAQEIEPGKFRARIWINPFIKGNPDAPFKQTDKIYSLER